MTPRNYRGPTAKPPRRTASGSNHAAVALAEGEATADVGGDVAPAPLRRTGFALTDLGRRRTSNEDAFFMDDQLGLYVVADGMGGHAAGEVASSEAVDTVYGMVKRGLGGLRELVDPVPEADARAACRLMESAVQAATYHVFSIAEIDRAKSGMGTTISALLVLGDYAVTAQVGDSRIYRVEGTRVEQLTEDHTLIAWQLKQGLITPQEAARSPHRNVITRAVGNREYVQVDTRCVALSAAARFLLCSDGLHGYLRDDDIPAIVELGGGPAVKCFIDLANQRGGKDNITAVLVEID
jgi:serine/threonine protein phosphatase PrpC